MNSVILIVLDGYGIAPPSPGNAIYLAHPKNINSFYYSFPSTQLKASGEAVGLPSNEVGNTEVGHINLGAGRVVYQSFPRINLSIADGDFYKNKALLESLNHLNKTKGKLHLIGLIGEGVVHASIDHLYALLFFFKEHHFKNVYIHAITDGRDSPPKSAKNYLTNLQNRLDQLGFGEIVTIMGRYYAMDRDKRWERTEKAYRCLTQGIGCKVNMWNSAIDNSYKEGKTDEFIEPTNILNKKHEVILIEDNDAVIFYNYRIDRPRQLTKAFVLDNFEQEANKTSYDPYATKYYQKHASKELILNSPFKRGKKINNLYFLTMTEYERNLPVAVAFSPSIIKMPLGRVLSENEIPQLRITESEKERFVTYYFNGLREIRFPLEDRLIVPSPKVATYDLKPEMSAYEITDVLIKKMYELKYRFILVNFANPDMVGHTGNLQAGIQAISTIDDCVGKIVNIALKLDQSVIITADHGNIEEMIDLKTGQISTEHSANPVPFLVLNNKFQGRAVKFQQGILADIAPTILSILNISKVGEMTGRDLLEEIKY
jgi:2,3-bisphosphoglycerate-independent phosphoglycerate mutase